MQFTSMPVLAKLSSMKRLDASFNKLKKIQYISHLKDLRELRMYHNFLTNADNLPQDLMFLALQDNMIEEVDGLLSLKRLSYLSISGNKISSLRSLKNLRLLTALDASQNRISSCNGLETVTKLRELNLSFNTIASFQGLQDCGKLEELQMNHNKITTLKGFPDLVFLQILRLNNNHLTNISGLSKCTQLRELHVAGNAITQINGVKFLGNLEILDLSDNKISDASMFVPLSSCPYLSELSVTGNPCMNVPAHVVSESSDWEESIRHELRRICPSLAMFNDFPLPKKTEDVDLQNSAEEGEEGGERDSLAVDHQFDPTEEEMRAFKLELGIHDDLLALNAEVEAELEKEFSAPPLSARAVAENPASLGEIQDDARTLTRQMDQLRGKLADLKFKLSDQPARLEQIKQERIETRSRQRLHDALVFSLLDEEEKKREQAAAAAPVDPAAPVASHVPTAASKTVVPPKQRSKGYSTFKLPKKAVERIEKERNENQSNLS